MKIHGLRIYPQSLEALPGEGGPIFVHGAVSDDCSDFFYIFRPLAPSWRGHLFADSFTVTYKGDLSGIEDPMPDLRNQFGASLVDAEMDGQLMLLRGDDFGSWGRARYCWEGAFLPIFRARPPFDLLRRLYWDPDSPLTSATWPVELKSVLHMWDDIYWQIFSSDPSDIDFLIETHAGDPKLKLFFVDLDREYPYPSNQELQPATTPDRS